MATREAYQQKFAAQLKEWDAKVDQLSAQVKVASADSRIKYENELEALRTQRAAVQTHLAALGTRSEHAWEDLKQGAEKTWAEMNKTMESIAAHFRK